MPNRRAHKQGSVLGNYDDRKLGSDAKVQTNDDDNCDKAISSTIDLYNRPKLTYLELIIEAFKSTKTTPLRTCEIVTLIIDRYPFFAGVKNVTQCVFQRLAADKCFKKAYPKIDAWPRWKFMGVDGNNTKVETAEPRVKKRISCQQGRRTRIRKPPDYFAGEDWKIAKQYRSLRNRKLENEGSNSTQFNGEKNEISLSNDKTNGKEVLKQSLESQFFGYLRLAYKPSIKSIHRKLKSPKKCAKANPKPRLDWKPKKARWIDGNCTYNTRSRVEIISDDEKVSKPRAGQTENINQNAITDKELTPTVPSHQGIDVNKLADEIIPTTKYKTILPAPKKKSIHKYIMPNSGGKYDATEQMPISKPPPNCFRPIPLKLIKADPSNEQIIFRQNIVLNNRAITKPVTVIYPQTNNIYVEAPRQGFVNVLNQERHIRSQDNSFNGRDRSAQVSPRSYYTRNIGDTSRDSQNKIRRQQYQVPCPRGYPDCSHTYNVPITAPKSPKMPVIQSVYSLKDQESDFDFGRRDTNRQEFINQSTTHPQTDNVDFLQSQWMNYHHQHEHFNNFQGYHKDNQERGNVVHHGNRQFIKYNPFTYSPF